MVVGFHGYKEDKQIYTGTKSEEATPVEFCSLEFYLIDSWLP